MTIAAVAAAGFVVVQFLVPLLFTAVGLALKLVLWAVIAYVVLRLINPGLASSVKERCCGKSSSEGEI
ncbi:MAG: hypothetical protein J4G03_01230 [Gemmatimonadetes bacterium]|nr:hypothetical protein [Gemmatimonadota bacterium]